MNKKSTLTVLLVAMVLLNIALVAFMLFKSPKGPNHTNRPKVKGKEFIQKEFGLSDDQMITFDKSKEAHLEATKSLNREIQKSSIEFYQYSGDSIVKDSLLQVVSTLNRSFYLINDKHIAELRALCSPDKQDALERFINAQINNRGNKPPQRKPKDGPKPK